MFKYSFLLLLCLSGTAAMALAGQDNRAAQPALLPVSATTAETFESPATPAIDLKELDRCLLKLKAEREALASEQSTAKQQIPEGAATEGPEMAKLRARLGQLIGKLGTASESKKGTEGPALISQPVSPSVDIGKKGDAGKQHLGTDKGPAKTIEKQVPEAAPPADPLALGHVLFKAGNYELALKAYRMVSTTGMKADERAPIQYLTATCLRKMGKFEDAAAIYRDVANVRGDEQVAACAQWQLVQLRWRSEFEAQLKDVRDRRKALETSK